MFLVSMESYDKGLLGIIWFKAPLWIPDRKSRTEIGKIGENRDFFVGVKIWNFLKFYYFSIFALVIWVLCENFNENEARLLILGQSQFLRGLTRKLRFSVNMRSQKGHKYWTQLPTTMKFCHNVPQMYIVKVKDFQVWKNIRKSRLGNFGLKIGKSGKIWSFSSWGFQFENFWN